MRFLRPTLLAVVLVLSQWLAVVHASEHHSLAAAHDCAVCAHAQGHDAAPAAGPAALSLSVEASTRAPPVVARAPADVRRPYQSRGPPFPR